MIDPRELRIGNYVYFTDFPVIDRLVKLTINEFKNGNDWFEYFITPIPLTEQWLIDFNCVRLGSAFSYDINKHCRLSIYPESGIYHLELQALNIETGADEIETFVTLNSIKYVHSFQNLIFSLTGKELTKQ